MRQQMASLDSFEASSVKAAAAELRSQSAKAKDTDSQRFGTFPVTGLAGAVGSFISFDMNEPSATPATSPARCPSHEMPAMVGRMPLSMPPYPRIHTTDKQRVPNVRLNQAREAT